MQFSAKFNCINDKREVFAIVELEIEEDRKCEVHIKVDRGLRVVEAKSLFLFLQEWQKGLLQQQLVTEFYAIIPLMERSAQKLVKKLGWERAPELDYEDGLGFRKRLSDGKEKSADGYYNARI